MTEQLEEWVCDSNEAVSLRLVRDLKDQDVLQGDDNKLVKPFHPAFTYPIYGEKEVIFGYKELSVNLSFASGSLKQLVDITYSDALESEVTPPDDVEGLLYNFIPADYTKSKFAFDQTVEEDAKTFKPLGEKIGSYTRAAATPKGKGKAKANGNVEEGLKEGDEGVVVFEAYKTTWDTPGFKEYHRRMQLFILLFIEGGSYIHEDEEAWEFITLFEKRRRPGSDLSTFHFAGYTSVYPFWYFPDQVRLRLSQFVILPPYQRQGHGSKLYSTLYQHVLGRSEVAELTVEDPAESFEDLRDVNDLRFLVAEGVTEDPLFTQGVGQNERGPRAKWEKEIRNKYKLAQRQFDRCLEMLLLKQLDKKDPVKVKAYRVHVKARLYRFNYQMLATMTPEERKEVLAATYTSVVEDYERLLKAAFPRGQEM